MDEVMLHGGLLVAKALKREGVEIVFTLSAGHLAAIYDGCAREGIRVMDTRHEQVAVHAAEGWARLTRGPGVALLTAGPGVTDGITGIANANAAGSPVIIFGGAAPIQNWDQGALQDMRHLDLVRPITKWARTVLQTEAARRVHLDGLPRGDHRQAGTRLPRMPDGRPQRHHPQRRGRDPHRRLPHHDQAAARSACHRARRCPPCRSPSAP